MPALPYFESADWEYSNRMPKARLWECVLLSLGSEPRGKDIHWIIRNGQHPPLVPAIERFEIAVHNVTNHKNGPLYPVAIHGEFIYCEFNIPLFVAWAKNEMKWDVPKEFTGHTPPASPAVITQPPAQPVPPIGDRERDNLHRIVGAMLAYIKGERGSRQHRDYKSEAELIRTLVDKNDGNEGVSERNLQKVFSLSKQQLK